MVEECLMNFWYKPKITKSFIFAILVVMFVLALGSNILGKSYNAADATARPLYTSPVNISTMLANMRGMNYYPSNDAWSYMWTNWSEASFNSDMAKIAGMGANSVRIIVPANTFGYPVPNPVMLSELQQAINTAHANGLTVDLTLFDQWDNYTDITGSETWANDV